MPAQPSEDVVVEDLPALQRTLRLAVVTETWPPEVNGVATTIARLVQGLQQRNHAIQLVRPRQAQADAATPHNPELDEVLMRGVPIPRYPQLRMGIPSRGALVKLWSLRRPDLVHVATEGPLGWSALRAALQLKLPVTTDFRTNFHTYSRHYGVGWLGKPILGYLRKFHNRANATMVPTDALRRELSQAGFHRPVVVARGVDTRLFDPARRDPALRARWGVGEQDLVVACVGRLAPEKNLDLLLRAFASVQDLRPDARLLLVGEGPMRETLRQRVPHAVFAGLRRGEDLAAHYASADLFLFPSMTETFGNVTAEAMASGLPVLAYDCAAAAQMIRSGDSGLLAPLGDETEFLRMARLLAGSPGLRARLGEQARLRAQAQDWDAVISRFEAVAEQALRDMATDAPLVWPAGQPT